ncbi:MAG: hypothetical protein MSH61_06100 [Bacteroidales bacterium]|nr:hypothetical protein [Bacteroidales bacterium]
MDFSIRIGRGPRCRYDRCRRAIPHCSSDDAASIPKSGPEIKNRCTQEGLNREKLALIPKSEPEIKNRCTQEGLNREKLASIPKSGLEIKNRCTQKVVFGKIFASIPKSEPEIKNRCTQEGLNREKLASIPKSGPEIKNRCTQQDINEEILASILKSASRGFDSGGRAGADAPGGGISLCFCRRGCAAPAQKAATLNDHCRRGQSMERTVRCLPETVKWMFIPAKLRPYTL